VLIGHVDSKEDFAIEAKATLETSEAPGQGKVGQDVVFCRVPGFHDFLAEFALPSASSLLELAVRVEAIDRFLLDHNF